MLRPLRHDADAQRLQRPQVELRQHVPLGRERAAEGAGVQQGGHRVGDLDDLCAQRPILPSSAWSSLLSIRSSLGITDSMRGLLLGAVHLELRRGGLRGTRLRDRQQPEGKQGGEQQRGHRHEDPEVADQPLDELAVAPAVGAALALQLVMRIPFARLAHDASSCFVAKATSQSSQELGVDAVGLPASVVPPPFLLVAAGLDDLVDPDSAGVVGLLDPVAGLRLHLRAGQHQVFGVDQVVPERHDGASRRSPGRCGPASGRRWRSPPPSRRPGDR